MKVLVLNGSPRANECTGTALKEVVDILEQEGIETETIQVGIKSIRGCIACNACSEMGKCVFDDLVNEVADKLKIPCKYRDADKYDPWWDCYYKRDLVDSDVEQIGDLIIIKYLYV